MVLARDVAAVAGEFFVKATRTGLTLSRAGNSPAAWRNPRGSDACYDPAEPMEQHPQKSVGSIARSNAHGQRRGFKTRGKVGVSTGNDHLGVRCVKVR
jgi:hypothetical protein